MEQLLQDNFIERFEDFPSNMNQLGKFVNLRTYSRYLYDKGRREVWKETVRRSVEYNVNLAVKHLNKLQIPVDTNYYRQEAEKLFQSMFRLDQFLSGRTLWVGGADTKVADKYPLANFNCAYIAVRKWEDLADLFYLLLIGTGVGFRSTKKMAAQMPKIRTNVSIEHVPYAYAGKANHLENSVLIARNEKGEPVSAKLNKEIDTAEIYVGDSKEGWVEALRYYFDILTKEEYEHIKTIRFSYNHVRPKGSRLKTFGGTASGPEPLQEMFQGIDDVLKNRIDETLEPIKVDEKGYGNVRPIHILDIGNLIGNNVVVGGVRRTAEIFLFDPDDFESLWAKYGVNGFWKEEDFKRHEELKRYCEKHGIETPEWFDKLGERFYDETVNIDFVTKQPRREADGSLSPYNPGTGFYHRAMSNNSIAFIDKPSRKFLQFVFTLMKSEGEPGFINIYEAAKRRLSEMGIHDDKLIREYAEIIGLNPCAEILLWPYGVCNLTTVNVKNFVTEVNGKYHLDREGLLEAQRMSARSGVRMTLVDLELPHWDEVQKRDRLVGASLTGWKDAMELLGYNKQQEIQLLQELRDAANQTAQEYAKQLRIPAPLLVTTIKPEGTLSQVAGGVSSGLHWAHSEYYIRRVRINAEDPLAKAVLDHEGWNVNPENGTPGETYEERMGNARTYVIDFPVFSGTKVNEDDVPVKEQLDNYFMFQEHYTSHNSSNTIKVRPHEWMEACEIILDNWENFIGVSFLALDGGTYQLAPYEAITKEQYEKLAEKMADFDFDILQRYETVGDSELSIEGMEGCEGGICPIR